MKNRKRIATLCFDTLKHSDPFYIPFVRFFYDTDHPDEILMALQAGSYSDMTWIKNSVIKEPGFNLVEFSRNSLHSLFLHLKKSKLEEVDSHVTRFGRRFLAKTIRLTNGYLNDDVNIIVERFDEDKDGYFGWVEGCEEFDLEFFFEEDSEVYEYFGITKEVI